MSGPLPVAPVKQTERPHPLTPFIRGWIVLVAIVFAFSRELIPDGRRGGGIEFSQLRWLLLALLAAVLLALGAGFLSWYFTRFVIDDDELRIESGALVKRSTKVSFERLQSVDIIQPMAARPFGLVELRLEAGGGDSAVKLRYLPRAKADRLREFLLARAQGDRGLIADQTGPAASALTDLSADHATLVQVSTKRLLGSFLLSTEWMISAGTVVALVVVSMYVPVVSYALPGLIPLVLGAVTLFSRRVVSMFHFTLAESPRGLRVARGLTNLTSQSVPLDRVQGVRVSQALLWRPFGWYRVDVDIVGYANRSDENNRSDATSVLLPVATRPELELALSRVLPGLDLAAIELHRPPGRARWLRWFDFPTLRYGWDEWVLITQHGWLTNVRDLVPHAKTQSVRIEQGPVQRWFRLANVHVDTARGPVDAIARMLDPAVARELALTQLDRARAARTPRRSL